MDALSGIIYLKDKVSPILEQIARNSNRTMNSVGTSTKSTGRKIDQAVNQIIAANQRMSNQLGTVLNRMSSDARKSTAGYRALNRALKGMQSTLSGINKMAIRNKKMFDGAAASARKFATALKDVKRLQQGPGRQFTAGGQKMMSGAAMAGTSALPFAYGAMKMIKDFAKFEHQMQKVYALSDPAIVDAKMRQKYSAQAEHLGMTTQFTQTEAGYAMEQFTRAGIHGDRLLASMPAALNMAGANPELGLEGSAKLMSIVSNSFGLDVTEEKMNKIADVMSYLASHYQGSVEDFSEGMRYALGNVRALDGEFSDLAVGIAGLHNSGLMQSISGTSFNQMLKTFINPTDKNKEAMEAMGVDIYDKETGAPRFMFDVFKDIRAAIKGMEASGVKPKEINELLGKAFNVRGGRAMRSLITEPTDEQFQANYNLATDLRKDTNVATGSADRMREEQLKSMTGQTILFTSALSGANTQIIRLLNEDLTNTAFGQGFAVLTTGIQDIAKVMSLFREELAGGATPAEAIANAVHSAYQGSSGLYQYMEMIGAIVKGIYEGFMFMVGAIETAAGYFSEFTSQLDPSTIETLTKFATIFAASMAIAAPILLGIAGAVFTITQLSSMLSGAWMMISAVFSAISTTLGSSLLPILLAVVAVTDLFRGEGESMWDGFLNMLMGVYEAIKLVFMSTLMPMLVGIWDAMEPALMGLYEGWKSLKEEIRGFFQDETIQKIFGVFQWITEKVNYIVGYIAGFLGAGFVNLITAAVGAVKMLLSAVKDLAKGIWDTLVGFFTLDGGQFKEGILSSARFFAKIILGTMSLAARILYSIISFIPGATAMLNSMGATPEAIEQQIQDFEKWADNNLITADEKKRRAEEKRVKAMQAETSMSYENDGGFFDVDHNRTKKMYEKSMSKAEELKRGREDLAQQSLATQKDMAKKLDDIKDKDNNTTVVLDNKKLGKSQSNRQSILKDRIGSKLTPAVRRLYAEQGYWS